MHVLTEDSTSRAGRKAGLKYRQLDMQTFLWEHRLQDILYEHAELVPEIALVENVQLTKAPSRPNFNEVVLNGVRYKGAVELSSKVLDSGTVEAQRNAFIRIICHFIAFKVFKTRTGQEYALFVKRYMDKRHTPQEQHNLGALLTVN